MASESLGFFRHFLYLGTPYNAVQANLSPKYPIENEAATQGLDIIIKNGQGQHILQEINRFYHEGLFLSSDGLIYALAICAHSTDAATRRAAFEVAKDVCKSAIEMFAFARFYKDTSKPSSGWGRAHRTFLINWYNKKDAKDLAAEIFRVKSRYKWTHKDILSMIHVKPKDASTAVVLKCILNGIEQAERDFASETTVGDLLAYLKQMHELKNTTDAQVAARLIEIHNLSHEYLPTQFSKSKEMWLCLIPRLPLKTLLEKLHHLYKLSLLKLDSPHYKLVMERLVSDDAIIEENIGPLETFIAICNLQQVCKNLAKKPGSRSSSIAPLLNEALQKIHSASFKTVPTTKKQYLVVLDRTVPLLIKKSIGHSAVYASQAHCILLMALVKAELSNITTIASSEEGLVPIDINENMTLTEIYQCVDKVQSLNPVIPTAPLKWATENKKQFDSVVLLSYGQPEQKDEEVLAALNEYRHAVNLPGARFVLCALSAEEFSNFEPMGCGLLKIAGLHMKLLKIIQDFTCHIF